MCKSKNSFSIYQPATKTVHLLVGVLCEMFELENDIDKKLCRVKCETVLKQ